VSECSSIVLQLPVRGAAEVLVELRLRGDYRNFLGAMGRGPPAALVAQLENCPIEKGLRRDCPGLPADIGRRVVGCGSPEDMGALVLGLPAKLGAPLVIELYRRRSVGPVLDSIAFSAARLVFLLRAYAEALISCP